MYSRMFHGLKKKSIFYSNIHLMNQLIYAAVEVNV